MNGHPASTLAEGRHAYTLRVYYEDTDAGGVVYHASYLRYAERARTEALRDLGIPHAALVARYGLMFVVRRIKVDYLRPARLDALLTVVTEPLAVGGASLVLRQEILDGSASCAGTGSATCLRPAERRQAGPAAAALAIGADGNARRKGWA